MENYGSIVEKLETIISNQQEAIKLLTNMVEKGVYKRRVLDDGSGGSALLALVILLVICFFIMFLVEYLKNGKR